MTSVSHQECHYVVGKGLAASVSPHLWPALVWQPWLARAVTADALVEISFSPQRMKKTILFIEVQETAWKAKVNIPEGKCAVEYHSFKTLIP